MFIASQSLFLISYILIESGISSRQRYLFELGDLTTGDSWFMNNWAYLDDDGFYPIEGNRFHDAELSFPIYQVSEFVTQNRAWLNTQEGFHTHVRSIEYQLQLSSQRKSTLNFYAHLSQSKRGARGNKILAHGCIWKDMDFIRKLPVLLVFCLRPGVSLSPEQIPLVHSHES